MGAPLVRRDELDVELAKLRKMIRADKRKAAAELAEALAPILAALDPTAPDDEPQEPATGDGGPDAAPTPLEAFGGPQEPADAPEGAEAAQGGDELELELKGA